jgi:CubicO group peptidase (beta-lactamase class C family)
MIMRLFVLATAFLCTIASARAEQLGGLRVAGLVTATADAQGGVVAAARGCAVFAEDGRTCARAMTPDALMRVASISKFVTAVGVMRMVEAGQLDLDRDVSEYLDYPVRNPAFLRVAVTLRQILSHKSSLMDGPGYVFGLGESFAPSVTEPGRWDAAHAPGTYFRYSNYNLVLVGTIMETVSGERFDRLMARLVLRPLDVEGCFNWDACADAALTRAAALYRTGEDETKYDPNGPWVAQVDALKGQRPACPVYRADKTRPCDLAGIVPGVNGGLFSPQGGLRISAAGLAKIGQMLLRGGMGPRGRFLKASTVRAFLTPQWRLAADAPGETERGTMCAYGLSAHVLGGAADPACKDNVFGDGRMRAGHIGEAYGLYGGLWLDLQAKRVSVYLITGTSQSPSDAPGQHSAFSRLEEEAAALSR